MTKLGSIQFSRYKAFQDQQTLEIRPITLLFGWNSAGKSAALRLINVLSDATNTGRSPTFGRAILNYNTSALRGASFAEIANIDNAKSGMEFAITWEDGVKYQFEIKQSAHLDYEFVAEFSIESDGSALSATNIDPDNDLFDVEGSSLGSPQRVEFSGIVPVAMSGCEPEVGDLCVMISRRLNAMASSVHWISAVRAQPPRLFQLSPGMPLAISFDGSGTAEVLRANALVGDGAVAKDVSDWLLSACDVSLSFASTDGQLVQGRQWFPFTVKSRKGTTEVSVRDVGEGIAQALPVITLCRMGVRGQLGPNPIIALEQPELHLHPKASTLLADAIVKCVEDKSPSKHIIETHSESFLLALQIALLEKRISKNDIIIYWVDAGGDGSSLVPVKFDEEGYPSDGWPDNVFRETLEQARRVSELRLGQ